jgi:hypothetical protein
MEPIRKYFYTPFQFQPQHSIQANSSNICWLHVGSCKQLPKKALQGTATHVHSISFHILVITITWEFKITVQYPQHNFKKMSQEGRCQVVWHCHSNYNSQYAWFLNIYISKVPSSHSPWFAVTTCSFISAVSLVFMLFKAKFMLHVTASDIHYGGNS